MINVEVVRNSNENPLGVIRRFTRKVQSSGVIPRVRSLRSSTRIQSKFKIKQKTLKSLKRKEEIAQLIKLGKISAKDHTKRK